MTALRIAVVGGGLAGSTAALRCADAGARVVLLESRARLGGLAGSARRGPLDVDTGQHVFLRCCTAYRALLDRIGASDLVTLQDRLDIPVHRPGRRPSRLRRTGLPAPLHLGGALARYAPLRPVERLRLVPAALALRGVDPDDPATDRRSFGDWLRAHGQGERAVAALWDLVGIATLNAPAERASLALAATVFQQGLLSTAGAGDIGWARVSLGRVHDDAVRRALTDAGVDVRTGTRALVAQPAPDGGWTVHTRRRRADPVAGDDNPSDIMSHTSNTGHTGTNDGAIPDREETLTVDRIVCAVPPASTDALLPPGTVPGPPDRADRLGASPIVNLHVVYDRRVLDGPFAACVDSPVQWVFDRTAASGADRAHPTGAQYLAVSQSAADDLVGLPVAQLRERFLPELARLFPAARGARVLDFFVTREPQATFRAAPGSGALRPPPGTVAPGLALAGAWTATGWPATMEGAVRSGDAAAAAVLSTPAVTEVAA